MLQPPAPPPGPPCAWARAGVKLHHFVPPQKHAPFYWLLCVYCVPCLAQVIQETESGGEEQADSMFGSEEGGEGEGMVTQVSRLLAWTLLLFQGSQKSAA